MIRLLGMAVAVLLAGTAAAVEPPPAPTDIPQLPELPQLSAAERYKTEIVCKTTLVTGSTFVRRKSCLTRKQWDYVADEQQVAARKLVEENGRNARSF